MLMESSDIYTCMQFLTGMSLNNYYKLLSKIDAGNYYALGLKGCLSLVKWDRQNPAAVPSCTTVKRSQELAKK